MAAYRHRPSSGPSLTLAVVGDVHDHWDDESSNALASLGADVAIFVGDFGNENVDIVKKIASVEIPERKIFMCGNHEAFYSMTSRGRQRAARIAMMSSNLKNMKNGGPGNNSAVDQILDVLGSRHIGLSSSSYQELGLSFVGGRPFAGASGRWTDVAAFYEQHYGITSLEDSAHRIVDIALSQPHDLSLVMVAHNGPAGLGNRRHSICGVDWQLPEVDFGDADLAEAINTVTAQGRPISLVLFGHMHDALKGGGKRDMAHVDEVTGTIYLNSAVVPRVKKFVDMNTRGHHFLLVDMENGEVTGARHVWADGQGAEINNPNILATEEVLKVCAAGDGSGRKVVSYYKANSDEWVPVVLASSSGGVDSQLAERELV